MIQLRHIKIPPHNWDLHLSCRATSMKNQLKWNWFHWNIVNRELREKKGDAKRVSQLTQVRNWEAGEILWQGSNLTSVGVRGLSPRQGSQIQKNREGKGNPSSTGGGKQWRAGSPSKLQPQHPRQRVTPLLHHQWQSLWSGLGERPSHKYPHLRARLWGSWLVHPIGLWEVLPW